MHVQGVHGEVVRVQVEGLEKRLHGHFLPVQLVHNAVGVHAVGLFDEAQQVLLVHAGRGVDVGVHLGGTAGDTGPLEACANCVRSQEGTKGTQGGMTDQEQYNKINKRFQTFRKPNLIGGQV